MILTNWGYTLPDINTLPDMMTAQEYASMTGRADDTTRVTAEIAAACTAIRNFVGWHLSPSEACKLETIASDRRVTFTGHDIMIQLPARYVTAVSRVSIDGQEYTSHYIDTNGILRVFDVHAYIKRYAPIVVEYTAGLPADQMSAVSELIAHRVTHAMAVPAGITSEASGGVSVTYNANWVNNSRATALVGDNRDLLVPYKVQGVF